jgi:hypothetical protein
VLSYGFEIQDLENESSFWPPVVIRHKDTLTVTQDLLGRSLSDGFHERAQRAKVFDGRSQCCLWNYMAAMSRRGRRVKFYRSVLWRYFCVKLSLLIGMGFVIILGEKFTTPSTRLRVRL